MLDAQLPESNYVPHFDLVHHVKDRPGHDRRYAMNIQKVRDDLGWEPEISLEEGVRKTTTWYVENQDWVEKVRTKSEYQTWVKDNYQERDSK